MRKKPKVSHPWRKFNWLSGKPLSVKLIMSYVAENPKHKKGKRITARRSISKV